MLIRRDGPFPPGGFYFEDPKTSQKFDGMSCTFTEQVGKIISHRKLNPKVYPVTDLKALNFDYVAKELDDYTCTRLGSHPRFCVNDKDPRLRPVNLPNIVVPQCPRCGSALMPKYCPTCGGGGSKIIGWHCNNCNIEIEK